MVDTEAEIRELSHEALLEEFGLLFKIINRSNDKNEIEKISDKRDEINQKLNRIELAKINKKLLPDEIDEAITKLGSLTKELIKEKKRIKDITKKLKNTDEYIKQATDLLGTVSKLFILV